MLKGLWNSVTILFVLAQLLVLATPVPALAAEPAPDVAALPASDVTVVSQEQATALVEIAVRSEQYLQVAPDGTLSLKIDEPAALGVDQEFVDAYQAGLDELNELVRAGDLTINDDLSVVWHKDLPADDAATPKTPADAQPDWAAYPSSGGVMLYFNYYEAGRIPSHGLTYASTIGAYLGRSYTVPHYTYLFTRRYNHNAFSYHRYQYGTYFYTPWYHYRSPYYYKSIYFYRYSYYGRGYWATSRVYY